MYVYLWFIVLRESLLTVRLAVSEIKPVQSLTDRQTDRQTDGRTELSLSLHMRARVNKFIADSKTLQVYIHDAGMC